uniref:Uncharacterized protein n=1 Tax=Cyprinus carpio TaxID=7962 RepID=A0A8C1TMC7_CYPCA
GVVYFPDRPAVCVKSSRLDRWKKKAVYLQYTDATYRQEIEKPKWMVFLGPLISAQEDNVVIYSIHAHGDINIKVVDILCCSDDVTWRLQDSLRWDVKPQIIITTDDV